MSVPKIAILILAHKNQDQLNKLVDHMKTDFSIYIHIDSKSKIKIKNENNVQVIKKFRVYWGCFSQILATRELMKIAANYKHDRYLLISGQDLPIVSNQKIIKFFSDNENNYLHGEKLPASFWSKLPQGGLERMRYFYFNDYNVKKYVVNKRLRKYIKRFNKNLQYIEKKLHLFQDYFKLYRKIPNNLWGGINWFNLTHEAVIICLEKMYENKYINLFKHTKSADEIIIQSVIYNSHLATSCISDSLRYINFDYAAEPPNMITLKDYEKFYKSGNYLFAKKFDNNVNYVIMNKIYDNIKENPTHKHGVNGKSAS